MVDASWRSRLPCLMLETLVHGKMPLSRPPVGVAGSILLGAGGAMKPTPAPPQVSARMGGLVLEPVSACFASCWNELLDHLRILALLALASRTGSPSGGQGLLVLGREGSPSPVIVMANRHGEGDGQHGGPAPSLSAARSGVRV